MASAFTPLALHVVTQAVDGITDGLSGGKAGAPFFKVFSDALTADGKDAIGGGPVLRIIVALVSILCAGVVWLEMAVRAALLYVGGALGTLVYAGLVDRDLWGRVRRWVGIMGAVILVKPIIVIVLRLATTISGGKAAQESTSAVISGLAILILAIIASALLFQLLPGMGDDIVNARRNAYDPASSRTSAAVTRPVSMLRAGINTHAARDSAVRTANSSTSSSTQTTAASGMTAHSTRPTPPSPPQQQTPPAVPPRPTQPPTPPPPQRSPQDGNPR